MPIEIRKNKEKVNLKIMEIRRFPTLFDLFLIFLFKRKKIIK